MQLYMQRRIFYEAPNKKGMEGSRERKRGRGKIHDWAFNEIYQYLCTPKENYFLSKKLHYLYQVLEGRAGRNREGGGEKEF